MTLIELSPPVALRDFARLAAMSAGIFLPGANP
jgi:hypothetical protein